MAASTLVVGVAAAGTTKMSASGARNPARVRRGATVFAGAALPRSRDVIFLAPTTTSTTSLRPRQQSRGVVRGRRGRHYDVATPRAAILSPFAPTDVAPKKKDKKKLRLRIDDVWYDLSLIHI